MRGLGSAIRHFGLEDLRAMLDIRKLDDGNTVTVMSYDGQSDTEMYDISRPVPADLAVELDQVFVRAGAPLQKRMRIRTKRNSMTRKLKATPLILKWLRNASLWNLILILENPALNICRKPRNHRTLALKALFAVLVQLKRDDR